MVNTINCDNLELVIDDQSFFEQLLLCIRGETIHYSSIRKKNQDKQTKLLEEEINHLESVTNNQDLPELTEKLQDAKNKLQEIRKEHIKGLFVRSKVKWIENEEKPTKYFLGHLSHSGDLLLWVGVRRRASFVVLRALTSSSQELLGQS